VSPQSFLFSKATFEKLTRSGKILFLLDGFDEIKTSQRTSALRKIDQLTRDFPAANIVVTSRPTDIFNGWGPATIVKIRDYDLPQILDLVDRSPIEGDVKDAFRGKVEYSYIKSHKKFLSNPLLCNMMILTFMRGGDIPKQKHIFYKKAFETLYRHHDDMKFLYKRDYHSELPEDVFTRLWRTFCYFSYSERKFGFDADQLKAFIDKSANYLSVEVDAKAVASDFVESLCIIVKDGEQYSFLHRSFQEYGAALFICSERGVNVFLSLDRFNDNVNDDVLELALMTNRELVEQDYILPKLESVIKQMKRLRSIRKKMKLFYSGISLDKNEADGDFELYFTIPSRNSQSISHFAMFLRRNYRPMFDQGPYQKLRSWLRRLSREKGPNRKDIGFRVDLDDIDESSAAESPIVDLVKSYLDAFAAIRGEILERKKHQDQMLKV